jgi:hypothetical protein
MGYVGFVGFVVYFCSIPDFAYSMIQTEVLELLDQMTYHQTLLLPEVNAYHPDSLIVEMSVVAFQ